jgi:hypothetical protein
MVPNPTVTSRMPYEMKGGKRYTMILRKRMPMTAAWHAIDERMEMRREAVK